MTLDPTCFVRPDWPAPRHIRALCTSRSGGFSQGAYAGLNLAAHVGDDQQLVGRNRALLRLAAQLPAEPHWLTQVHGTVVVDARPAGPLITADGAVAREPGTVCTVLTADCLPILLCNRDGDRVAALHAGWRGLLDGIVAAGVHALATPPDQLLAWIGPGISRRHYEVGPELRTAFVTRNPGYADCFTALGARWTLALDQVCTHELLAQGVRSIYHSHRCTFEESAQFFSYRRQPVTGRMASLIWIERS